DQGDDDRVHCLRAGGLGDRGQQHRHQQHANPLSKPHAVLPFSIRRLGLVWCALEDSTLAFSNPSDVTLRFGVRTALIVSRLFRTLVSLSRAVASTRVVAWP